MYFFGAIGVAGYSAIYELIANYGKQDYSSNFKLLSAGNLFGPVSAAIGWKGP
jgi:hypothetical protein